MASYKGGLFWILFTKVPHFRLPLHQIARDPSLLHPRCCARALVIWETLGQKAPVKSSQ